MYNVKDFDQVKKNYRSFWNKEFIGRPYIMVTAPKNGFETSPNKQSYVQKLNAAKNGTFDAVVREYEARAKATMYYGEALPHFQADLCPDQHAIFYDGEIIGQEGQFTTWIKSNVAEELSELDLTFDRNNPNLRLVENAVKTAAEIADGNFLINVLDHHSNLDTLSALLSPQNLCYELIDNPELLREKLEIINNDYKTIYDIFYKAGRMDELGTLSWIPLYCEGRFSVVQCDFSCMISPSDARKYVIPSIEKELDCLDRAVYHYDGKMALGHFEDVLAIDRLDCVQWVPGAGEKRTIYWMDLLKRIQEKGKSVWVYDWTKEEILADTELDPTLTMFSVNVDSEAEAEDLMEKLEKKYR